MARYKYFTDEKNRKVIVISTYAGKTVRGVAKADPRDGFDAEKGAVLAKARCDAKVASKRAKNAQNRLNEAKEILDYAKQYYERMNSYYNDAISAKTIAKNSLNSLMETM